MYGTLVVTINCGVPVFNVVEHAECCCEVMDYTPLQILSGLLFQTFISPKDMSNQTIIPYVTPNYTAKR